MRFRAIQLPSAVVALRVAALDAVYELVVCYAYVYELVVLVVRRRLSTPCLVRLHVARCTHVVLAGLYCCNNCRVADQARLGSVLSVGFTHGHLCEKRKLVDQCVEARPMVSSTNRIRRIQSAAPSPQSAARHRQKLAQEIGGSADVVRILQSAQSSGDLPRASSQNAASTSDSDSDGHG